MSKLEVADESADGDGASVMQDIYREVLERGPLPRAGLSALVGTPAGDTDEAIEHLLALHLLHLQEGAPDTLVARSPDVAKARTFRPLRRSLQETQDHIASAALHLAELQVVYEEANADQGGKFIDLLSEPEDVNTMLEEDAAVCRTDLLTAQPGGPRPAEILGQAIDRDLEMLARGVRMRTLYQHSARYSQATEAYAERIAQIGGEVRTRSMRFPRLIVFDRKTAYISAKGGAGALRIRQPALVDFFVETFEIGWRAAIPITSAYETRRQKVIASDMQRSVAQLLLHEDKDAAIARQLGISERSCRQHIAKLMNQLGARNRTHLGYLIATEMRGTV